MKVKILDNNPANLSYADYCDWCKANDITPAPDRSTEFYQWAGDETNSNYDDDMCAIANFKPWQIPVRITGSLGLWDGTHRIAPDSHPTVMSALRKCIARNECVTLEYDFEDGTLHFTGVHHDGSNHFIIAAADGTKLPYLYDNQ